MTALFLWDKVSIKIIERLYQQGCLYVSGLAILKLLTKIEPLPVWHLYYRSINQRSCFFTIQPFCGTWPRRVLW